MLKKGLFDKFFLNFSSGKKSLLVKNILGVYGGDLFSQLISVGIFLLMIRGLSVRDYAAYTVFYAILSMMPGLIGAGINTSLVRFASEYLSVKKKQPYGLYFLNFIFQIAFYLLIFIIVYFMGNIVVKFLFGQKSFISSFRYGLIGGLGILLVQSGRSIFQAEENYGSYIKTLWLKQIIIFLFIAFFFIKRSLNFYIGAQIIIYTNLLIGFIIIVHIFRKYNILSIIEAIRNQFDLIKEFISSSKWLIIYFVFLMAFQRLDVFMLSHFSNTEELANYGIAFRYYSAILLLLGSIHTVLLPKFSKIDMQDINRQREFTIKWIKVTSWIIIPILFIDIFGKPLFLWLNGQQYERSFTIFVCFSLGIWISFMFSPLVNILKSRKSFKFLTSLSFSAFILNFIGNYLFIPIWGGLGAAFITIISHGLINIIVALRIIFTVNERKLSYE